MAFAIVGAEVIFTFSDDAGTEATTQVNVPLPPVLSYAAAVSFAATMAYAMRAISTAKVDRFLIRLSGFDPASAPPAQTLIYRLWRRSFMLTVMTRYGYRPCHLPAIPSMLLPGRSQALK